MSDLPVAVPAVVGTPTAPAEPLAASGVGVTRGVWRIHGSQRPAVLKVIQKPRSPIESEISAAHWHWWRREADLHADDGLERVLADLPIRAPRLLERTDLADGAIALWLEDVGTTRWTAAMLVDAAGRLGAAQAVLAHRAPVLPGTSRGFLADYTAFQHARILPAVDAATPVALRGWPAALRRRLDALAAARPRLLALVDTAPRTLCHLDCWPPNMAAGGRLALVDWAFAGDGALGEDAANLVPDTVFDGLVAIDDLAGFATAIVDAYVAGLRDGGWHGSDAHVRRTIAAAGAAKYTWLYGLMRERLAAGSALRMAAYDASSDEQVLERRRPVLDLLCGWAEEALA